MPDVAAIALDAWRKRRDNAWAAVDAGKTGEDQAERHLRPWAAIALLCGADPAAIHPDLPGMLEQRCKTHRARRWLVADDLCPRPQWLPLLARARDRAMATINDSTAPQDRKAAAYRMVELAMHLSHDPNGQHLPPYALPADERRAA